MFKNINYLFDSINNPPPDDESLEEWYLFKDVRCLLLDTDEDLLLYYEDGFKLPTSGLIFSVLVPRDAFNEDDIDDFHNWNPGYHPRWSCEIDDEGNKIIRPPFSNVESNIISKAEPIVYSRIVEGHIELSYLEISEKFSQLMKLFGYNNHDDHRHKSYFRIDETGDFEHLVNIFSDKTIRYCTVKRNELDYYMFLTDTVLVRFFDFTRSWDSGFVECNIKHKSDGLFFTASTYLTLRDTPGSHIKGYHIIRPNVTLRGTAKRLDPFDEEGQKYESFRSLDFKHGTTHKCSCDPKELDSYYIDTGKPFQTTLCYFSPEVLSRYRSNPDRYEFCGNSISCKGAWHLKTFDITDNNQIVVMLCDISLIPYIEQRRWEVFNEEPKGPVSRGFAQSQFLGKFPDEVDPFSKLNYTLDNFPSVKVDCENIDLWRYVGVANTRKTNRLAPVLTESSKEWADQIGELYRILIEGFQLESIRTISNRLDCFKKDLKSIKLLSVCLETIDIDHSDIDAITKPLQELIEIRNKTDHGGTYKVRGTYKTHYYDLISSCAESMERLSKIISNGRLDIKSEKQ